MKEAGGNGTWDRLGKYLEKEKSGKEAFIINRSFNASIDMVFDIWSDPAQLRQLLSPTGTSMEFLEIDICTDGKSFYKMGNVAFTVYGCASYIKVEKPYTMRIFTNGRISMSREWNGSFDKLEEYLGGKR